MSFDNALGFKPQRNSAHPDDIAVDNFAAAMKQKLAAARAKGRGGWQQASAEELSSLLVAHLDKGNAGTFEDVANFAMMLHQSKADPAVLASMFKAALTAVARGFNAVEGKQSQLIKDGIPSFYVSADGSVCTHRMSDTDKPVWCVNASDSLAVMNAIEHLNDRFLAPEHDERVKEQPIEHSRTFEENKGGAA